MRFQNQMNGYVEVCSAPFLWALLFGPLYFVIKGVWRHVILYFIINSVLIYTAFWSGWAGNDPGRTPIVTAVAIAGAILPFLIYPFIARDIIRYHFLRQGWVELNKDGSPRD
ncbi:hypothetical protein [Sphingobium sp. EM0848]|uniref:hypothetical protein n=1 Tax=Sphingobium sp. EM0848 TaxID=2743473 RepID=UPI00159C4437|nr:hypothetical protein [Sphingobium sp. EM0848]